MAKLLLTGFEPYATTPINPAELVASALDGESLASIDVISTIIPNTFFKSVDLVKKMMLKHKVDYVLMLGEYPGRALITFERFAHRLIDSSRYQLLDNEGVGYDNKNTADDGPVAYQSSLPLKAMVEILREKGIPADISDTAATFACNHLYYGVMHEIAVNRLPIKAVFSHLPMLPSTAVLQENLGKPSMALETAVEGIRYAIEAIGLFPEDIPRSLAAGFQI